MSYGPNPQDRRPTTYGHPLVDAHDRGDFVARSLVVGLVVFVVYVAGIGAVIFFESSRSSCVCPNASTR